MIISRTAAADRGEPRSCERSYGDLRFGYVVHAFSVFWGGGVPDKLLRSPEGNREQRTELSFG